MKEQLRYGRFSIFIFILLFRYHVSIFLRMRTSPGLYPCVWAGGGTVPVNAVGLGCDMDLNGAMYKALLEGVAVSHLSKVVSLDQYKGDQAKRSGLTYDSEIINLNSNVALFAMGGYGEIISAKFPKSGAMVHASELPSDWRGDTTQQIKLLAK